MLAWWRPLPAVWDTQNPRYRNFSRFQSARSGLGPETGQYVLGDPFERSHAVLLRSVEHELAEPQPVIGLQDVFHRGRRLPGIERIDDE